MTDTPEKDQTPTIESLIIEKSKTEKERDALKATVDKLTAALDTINETRTGELKAYITNHSALTEDMLKGKTVAELSTLKNGIDAAENPREHASVNKPRVDGRIIVDGLTAGRWDPETKTWKDGL